MTDGARTSGSCFRACECHRSSCRDAHSRARTLVAVLDSMCDASRDLAWDALLLAMCKVAERDHDPAATLARFTEVLNTVASELVGVAAPTAGGDE